MKGELFGVACGTISLLGPAGTTTHAYCRSYPSREGASATGLGHPGTNKLNGVMTLKMIMTKPIPSYVHLGPACLLVRHEGQPMNAIAGPILHPTALLKCVLTVGVSATLMQTAPKAVSVRAVGRLSTILLSVIPRSSQTRAELMSQFLRHRERPRWLSTPWEVKLAAQPQILKLRTLRRPRRIKPVPSTPPREMRRT